MTDLFNNPHMKPVRRELRRRMPPAEAVLWSRLRDRQVANFKFRRQYSVDRDVADFYCAEVHLSVEIDGFSHTFEEQWKRDEIRQQRIEALGITVVRFTNDEVFKKTDNVIEQIAQIAIELRDRKPHPNPLLGKEREPDDLDHVHNRKKT